MNILKNIRNSGANDTQVWSVAKKLGVDRALNHAGDKVYDDFSKGVLSADKMTGNTANGSAFANTMKPYEISIKNAIAQNSNNESLKNDVKAQWQALDQKKSASGFTKLLNYIQMRDDEDYQNGIYSTTKYLNSSDEDTKAIQRILNTLNFKDRFGQKLKEDGLWGAKTQWAWDMLQGQKDNSLEENREPYQNKIFQEKTDLYSYNPNKHSISNNKNNKMSVFDQYDFTYLGSSGRKGSTGDIYIKPFDYNTVYRLGSYGDSIKLLQNELKWLKCYDGEINGHYDIKTKNAVIDYQTKMGLNVDGEVGVNTWKSLGLIYRTKEDIDAGVTVYTSPEWKQYKDISVPLNNALSEIGAVAEKKWATDFGWLWSQVYNGKPWDIKRKGPWEKTIKSTYPGSFDAEVVLFGEITTPEKLGNITFGYIGAAMGISLDFLLAGSWGVAGFPTYGDALTNEFTDWSSIKQGYNWWYNGRGI